MDFEDVKEFLPTRIWLGLFLGAFLVPLGLALAYVHGGGMQLLGNQQFAQIDIYVYTAILLVGGIGVGGSFYLYHRDISSSLAVLTGMIWGLLFGLEDVLVYLVSMQHQVPAKLAWLNDSPVGLFASLLGFDEVTRLGLYTTVLVSGIIMLLLVKTLYEVETRIPGIGVEV